jgi:hypothetical protein
MKLPRWQCPSASPGEFDLQEIVGDEGCLVHQFRHPETGAFFRFDWYVRYRTGLVCEWWPLVAGREHQASPESWDEAKEIANVWLRLVAAEAEAQDLWAIAAQQRAWLTSTPEAFESNSPFSDSEQTAIAHHLKTIEEYTIRTYHLQEQQATFVRTQLLYLTEAAVRVGRFDWKNLAASTLLNIVMTLGLDVEKGRQLLAFAAPLLGPLLTGVRSLIGH